MRAVVSETLALSILVTSRAWALQESYETYEGHVGLHLSRGTDEGERLTRWTPGETGTSLICEVTQWCDNQVCSDVCARGTVRVPWWIENAHRLQHRLSSTLPLCDASFFGTHNSAITLADGYGNQDELFAGLLEYVEWLAPGTSRTIRTNDQYFSLTDQLNMGVRLVEIDVHQVLGSLRVAHCGGLHVDALNKLVRAMNYVARTLGYDIQWDTETVGCDPSLSSIPADYQRLFVDALTEIKAWMDVPRNAREFLLIYLDDEPDLLAWGVVPRLIEEIRGVFGDDEIFKPTDSRDRAGDALRDETASHSDWPSWPSFGDLLDRGFRAMFVSSSDYGHQMASHVFPRGPDVCNWQEPGLHDIDTSTCEGAYEEGVFLRIPSCQIQYGPLNCDFDLQKDNSPFLDEEMLRDLVSCGLSMPAPDLLTPERAAAAIWTWAPGYPEDSGGRCDDVTFVAATDGRWRTAGDGCDEVERLPLACRRAGAPPSRPNWVFARAEVGECPSGTIAGPPRHARENAALVDAMRDAQLVGARIVV